MLPIPSFNIDSWKMSEDLRKADKEHIKMDPAIAKEKGKIDFTKGSVNEYKFYPDNPTSEYNKSKFASKEPSKYYDPCAQSAQMSVRCLEDNNFDRDMCHEYFKAYRECKKEWLRQRRQDNFNGKGW